MERFIFYAENAVQWLGDGIMDSCATLRVSVSLCMCLKDYILTTFRSFLYNHLLPLERGAWFVGYAGLVPVLRLVELCSSKLGLGKISCPR